MREAGRLLREGLEGVFQREGLVRLAIPGGSALQALREAQRGLDAHVWKSTRLTWVDERCVPLASPDSNCGEARRMGLLDPAPALELALFQDSESPEEACHRVEAVLTASFERLDWLLLGLGEDGHIASLFPGRPWTPAPARVHLESQSPKPPAQRISLSLSMLSTASEAVVLAMGEGKRQALDRVLAGDASLPLLALNRVWIVTDLA